MEKETVVFIRDATEVHLPSSLTNIVIAYLDFAIYAEIACLTNLLQHNKHITKKTKENHECQKTFEDGILAYMPANNIDTIKTPLAELRVRERKYASSISRSDVVLFCKHYQTQLAQLDWSTNFDQCGQMVCSFMERRDTVHTVLEVYLLDRKHK